MAICNIFKEISKSTGTFLTFSQYAEDVTKQHSTGNNYRVVPSKFYTCNIDYSKLDNKSLPILLQNKFENGCAFLKDTMSDDWAPEYTYNLFWNSIRDLIIGDPITDSDKKPTGKFLSTINYIGDINIESYSSKDNIGYNEIYCYIPNDAKECSVKFEKSANENEFVECGHTYIMGYDESDTSISGVIGLKLSDCKELDRNKQNKIGYYKKLIYTGVEKTDIDSNLFQFNTIIISYNVVDNNGNKLYGGIDIPLGIYFTGTIDAGVMTNPVTKFVSNDDIYGAGTSYGLRICSRFTVTPNSTTIKSDVNLLEGNDAIYTAFSQAMGQMAESQIKMDEMLAATNEYNMGLKNHIMSISSNKVNVPYIKEVNGVKYWFCNGKNLNVPCQGIQGVTGSRGATGSRGMIGPRGVTGVCAFYGSKVDVTFTAMNEQISIHVRKSGTAYKNASIIEVQGLGGDSSADNKLNIYGLKNDEIIFLIYKRNESLGKFSLYDGDHGGVTLTSFWSANNLRDTKDGLLFMIGKHNDRYKVFSITKMENYGQNYDY
jgi:hypothetical protein